MSAEVCISYLRDALVIEQMQSEASRTSLLTGEYINKSHTVAIHTGTMEDGEDQFHKKFTPHTFRTVFTTLMRNQGMKQHVLQYIRGDAESETMDIYTRVDRDDVREEYLDCIKPLGL
ncbi:site-specific integrase [Halorientalis pallida]|uniref:Site-specific integrase n=1 Tax=Halorientalis pallida TaxID=2479928 RepID=A0A498L0A2_9EURY|nr:tyrosine-type recombinase/integrase [Halorientalis pallida]RXK51708.1 site-specific integrase [Halorientalis pallida]